MECSALQENFSLERSHANFRTSYVSTCQAVVRGHTDCSLECLPVYDGVNLGERLDD